MLVVIVTVSGHCFCSLMVSILGSSARFVSDILGNRTSRPKDNSP